MSTEFKKGDRIVFVKDDGFAGVKMPEGTRGTYVDDSPTNPAPDVLLDTGERVRAWSDSIAPAEDHGTGDGSASDICPVPGCNCDLERRFPAPLDPSKVKPGDTVTLRIEQGGNPALTLSGKTHTPATGYGVYLGGWRIDRLPDYVTLTAHQPAPAPEPVTGHGTAYVFGMVAQGIPQRRYHGFLLADGKFKFLDNDGRLTAAAPDRFDAFEPEPKPE